ncbi:MAG TPA: pantetheine-phosphate adenylyltransferase [Acidimicrobiales bacterium]
MKTALFPGSFDPFHNGHLEIVERASKLFDKIVVAAMRNPQKGEALFDLAERKQMIEDSVAGAGVRNVEVVSLARLVVDVAAEVRASAIIKGLRAVVDFENEMQMAQMNHRLSGIDTLLMPTGPTTSFIAAKLIREVARYGGDVSELVPPPVARRLKEKFAP